MPFKMNHSVSIDIMKTDTPPVVRMKQGDRMTREVTVNLLSDGEAWAAPSDVSVLQLAYCKSDKVGGCYDHMPDNSAAGTFNSARTAVTMQLHPQVLNVAGDVTCELRLLTDDGEILNAFNFIIYVQKSPIAMTLASEGYYNNVFDGATFIPHISPDGTVSWTNNKNLPNPAPVNVKGPQGDPGSDADVPDWAKQPEKPSYDAYDIQFFNKSWPSRPMDVGEALNDLQTNKLDKTDISDWAKQAAKPDYRANEIDYHTEFLGQEVGTVNDALAVAENEINRKLDKPEVLTWDKTVYPTLLDFLKTITVPGKYKFVDPIDDRDCEYELVISTADEDCYFGKLQWYASGNTGTRTFAAVGDISYLNETEEYAEIKRSTISIRLLSDMWQQIDDDVYEQTVEVSELEDVDEDEDILLQCCPAPQSIAACNTYGVQCMEATEGTMTFRATTHPAENENISVIVVMWR